MTGRSHPASLPISRNAIKARSQRAWTSKQHHALVRASSQPCGWLFFRLRFPRAVAGASRAPLRRQRDGRGVLDIPHAWCIFMDTRTKRGKEKHMALKPVKKIKNLYRCTRTSLLDYSKKPCKGAIRVDAVYVDERETSDPKKIPAFNGTDGDWYTEGTNHRVERGHIKRDLDREKVWAVKVKDIAAFVAKHGQCVVSINNEGWLTIEIYDDYRE